MVKKSISLLFSLFLLPWILYSSINLEVENTIIEQKSATDPMLPTVIIGNPFTLKISFDGSMTNKSIDMESITKNFRILSSSRNTNIQMINNTIKSTAIQQYEIMANMPGNFEIGPFTIDGITSNRITLVARKETNADKQVTSDSNDEQIVNEDDSAEIHLQIISDKTSAFTQEPILIKRLILQKGAIRQTQIEPFTCPAASIKKLQNELQRVETIEGKSYRITEERYLVFANKEGILAIPPQRFVYTFTPPQQRIQGHDPFHSMLQQFMHFSLQQAEGASNKIECQIEALPNGIQNIDAIGSFTNYSISIDKNEIEEDASLRLTLRLTGIGNFDEIPSPQLRLPEKNISVFPTEQKIEKEIDLFLNPGIKLFSFIIQPDKAGIFTIPEQIFTFFDPITKNVKQIKTEPISCTIHPSRAIKKDITQQIIPAETKQKAAQKELQNPAQVNAYQDSNIPPLPWFLFFLLLFSPILFIHKKLIKLIKNFKKKENPKLLFARLKEALTNKQYDVCNQLIKQIIAHKTAYSPIQITETIIEKILLEKNCTENELLIIKKIYLQTITQRQIQELTSETIDKGISILNKLFICLMLSFSSYVLQASETEKSILSITNNVEELLIKLEKQFENKKYADLLAISMQAQKKLPLSHLSAHINIFKILSKTRVILNPTDSLLKRLIKTSDDFLRPIPLLFFQLLFLLFWTLCICSLFYHRSNKKHKLFLALIIAIKSLGLYHSYQIHQIPLGIVKTEKSKIYSGPSSTYQKIASLKYAQACKILEATENFYKIKTENGLFGWSEKKNFLST